MNFSQALDLLKQGRRVRRVGWDSWVTLINEAFYHTPLEGNITRFPWMDTHDLLAEDWEIEPIPQERPVLGSTLSLALLCQPQQCFKIQVEGIEFLRVTEKGEVYIRGELVESNKEVAERLLSLFEVHNVIEPGPWKSRLERILEDD